jgi:hypothetical protein
MANIKLENILKDAFPINRVEIVNQYYNLTSKKHSDKYFLKWDRIYKSKWEIIKFLELDRKTNPRKYILDIGAGPHIFAWLAVRLGHSVTTTELSLENDYIHSDIIRYFQDIKIAINLDKIVDTYDWIIDKQTNELPGPLRKRWDIISMQRSNFDIGWQATDYHRLIKLLCNCLESENSCIYYEIAREQYKHLVEYLKTTKYTFESSIGDNQGRIVIRNVTQEP